MFISSNEKKTGAALTAESRGDAGGVGFGDFCSWLRACSVGIGGDCRMSGKLSAGMCICCGFCLCTSLSRGTNRGENSLSRDTIRGEVGEDLVADGGMACT